MKADRRTVLKFGVAAGTLPLTAAAFQPVTPGTTAPGKNLEIYKVLYDERFTQGREFGRSSQRLGMTVAAIRNDVTDIWYKDLYFRWKEGPASISGLTSNTALFCLQQLARDVNMHVVYRAEHSRTDGQRVISRTANRLANFPRSGLAHRMPTDSTLPGWQGQHDEQLVSWIIAPLA